jgi:flagellar protein FliO/FliZ
MLKWLRDADSRERRPRRIAVIDAAPVDARRSVVLIRRDSVEHLLMIGGPADLVIESNILQAAVKRQPAPPPTRGWLDMRHVGMSGRTAGAQPPSATERHLAELTRQLEAVLGRAAVPRHRPPVDAASIAPENPVTPPDSPIIELEPASVQTSDAKPELKSDAESEVERKLEQPLKPRLNT